MWLKYETAAYSRAKAVPELPDTGNSQGIMKERRHEHVHKNTLKRGSSRLTLNYQHAYQVIAYLAMYMVQIFKYTIVCYPLTELHIA